MKQKILVLGSVVADVILRLPHLPKTKEDLHIEKQTLSLGGCAGNVAMLLQALQIPYDLCAPIGQGIYGAYVNEELKKRGMHSILPRSHESNGCCYCMVEKHGERTFLSDHGAEYRFLPEWFDLIQTTQYDHVYVCGLELEEPSGALIIEHVKHASYKHIYFAPGPRIHHIPSNRMQAMFQLHCALHLNEEEACGYTNTDKVEEAAEQLYALTHHTVIITLGEKGCLIYDQGQIIKVPSSTVTVMDTIGAGDSHIAAWIAAQSLSLPIPLSGEFANLCSGMVVSQVGAHLSSQQIQMLTAWLKEKVMTAP